MPTEEQIRLILALQGFESIDQVIKQFRDLKAAGEDLTKEQEQGLIALEMVRDVYKDVGQAEREYADTLVREAQDRRAANLMIDEATRAAEAMRAKEEELAAVTERNAAALQELAGAEEGKGFGGLASNIMKAEKVAMAVGTGHGLARMGPMLESITSALGMAGGAGMAAGGLLYALEGIIPKVSAFFEEWEKGAAKIDEVNKALTAFRSAQASGQTSRQRRRLGKIESQIAALEDKEDEEGYLTPGETQDLWKLRRAAAEGRAALDQEERDVKASDAELARRQRADDARADAEFEATDPDQQYMERHHARIAAHNAGVDAANAALARRKRVEAALGRRTRADVDALDADERDAAAATRQADRDARKAAAEAARDARAGTPGALNARLRREESDAWLGAVQRNTYGFTGDEQAAIARHAQQNAQMGAGMADAISAAIEQTRADIAAGFARQMRRQQQAAAQWSESRLGE